MFQVKNLILLILFEGHSLINYINICQIKKDEICLSRSLWTVAECYSKECLQDNENNVQKIFHNNGK